MLDLVSLIDTFGTNTFLPQSETEPVFPEIINHGQTRHTRLSPSFESRSQAYHELTPKNLYFKATTTQSPHS